MAEIRGIQLSKELDMANTVEYKDLCSTCNYGPTCVRRQHHGKPVWQCEEFDDFQPAPKRTIPPKAAERKVRSSRAVRGLCESCDNIDICSIPETDGGIWHCEEFA
jgi:hypothetical protein